MRELVKKASNPYFWIGFEAVMVLLIIFMVFDGSLSVKKAMIYGTVFILFTGLNLMKIERKKNHN